MGQRPTPLGEASFDIGIEIDRGSSDIVLKTVGATPLLGCELTAVLQEDWAIQEAQEILLKAVEELTARRSKDQLRTWGGHRSVYWRRAEDGLHAYERSGNTFHLGVQRTAAALGAQRWVCDTYQAPYEPCYENDLIALSPAALVAGTPVEGVRYLPESAMQSGWFLIEDTFDGSVDDLENHHAYDVTAVRSDLERYFGLPPGWRFYRTTVGENVYPDPNRSEKAKRSN